MSSTAEKRALPATISIVVPFYNESSVIEACLQRIIAVVQPISQNWEIICVNDGSTDATLDILTAYHAKTPNIKVISLSRNFGKEVALTAGLDHANGDVVIPMDSDMQDPPELIPDMVKKWQEGFDVVLAIRNHKQQKHSLRTFLGKLFYLLIGSISNPKITKDAGDFRLLDRKVIVAIRKMPERTRFMKGIMSWAGFRTTHILFDRPPRHKGQSRWSAIQLFGLAADGIFSFSSFPIRIIGLAGSLFLICGTLGLLWAGLFANHAAPYSMLFSTVLLVSGVNLLALWLIGEYVARISQEVRQRPLYIIDETIGV